MPNIAAIDVGSNAIRLLLLSFNRYGIEKKQRFVRYPLRLGADVFASQYIQPKTTFQLLEIFSDIATRIKKANIEHYRAVATSAMRDAKNGTELTQHILKKTMINVEIISGREESNLSKSALLQAVGHVSPLPLLIDLGGGSLEIEHANKTKGKSLPFGTVRIAAQHPKLCAVIKTIDLENETEKICQKIRKRLPKKEVTPLAIGTGGNLDVLSKLIPHQQSELSSIDVKKLDALAKDLGKLTIKERQKIYALRSDRADIILPAVVIIQALARIYGIKKIIVPGTGLREALLEKISTDIARTQIENLIKPPKGKIKLDLKSINRLVDLFSQLKPIHHLWGSALELCLQAVFYHAQILPTAPPTADGKNIKNPPWLTPAKKRDLNYILSQTKPKQSGKHPAPPNQDHRQACDKIAAICALHLWHESRPPSQAPEISFENQTVIIKFAYQATPPKYLKNTLEHALKRKIKFSYKRS